MSTEQAASAEHYARFQPIDQALNIANKQRLRAIMQQLIDAPPAELNDAIGAGYHAGASINISHPINELGSLDALAEQFWQPLLHALPDLERRYDMLVGGMYRDAQWIGCWGHYAGSFVNDWLGIPASGGVVAVRYAEGHELRDGKIAASYIFVDWLDLMRQVGYWPIAPSLGRELQWLSPLTHDGVILEPQAEAVSRHSHELIRRMHSSLDVHNGQTLTREMMDLIEQEDAKHFAANFMWYGPAGIGTTRGIKGFDDYHGHPFLMAFPDRGARDTVHFIRIADGHFAVTGGWGYLQATHSGPGFLGLPPTGKQVAMRVMDFYRCDDRTICENWVPIDIPHLLLQLGVDVFGRMRHQFRQHEKLSVRSWLLGC